MQFDLVRRLGITVVEVPELDVDVAYVPRHHVALVCMGLPPIAREKAADWILTAATSPQASSTPQPRS